MRTARLHMLQMDSEELEEASPDAHGSHKSYMVGQRGGGVGMPHKSIATPSSSG